MMDGVEATVKALIFFAVAAGVATARPDTTQVSGNVSGVWDDTLGPYAVVGEVTVPAGETLIIRPGVEVRFRGRYHLTVNGVLLAQGAESDSVVFTRDQPTEEHKWKGIRFENALPGCTLAYCRIEYVKNDGPYPEVRGGAVYCSYSSPVVSHCALCHNYSHNANANGGGGGVFAEFSSPVVEYCHVFDNYVDSGGGICTLEECSALFSNNLIEDNTATYSGGGMYLGVRSGPTVTGNVIRRNRCAGGWGGGGITLWNWYAIGPVSKTVTNNLLYANSASDAGGGIYTRYDLSFIYNNTIVENSANRGGGIYVLNEGQFLPDVRNCIVYDNTASNGASVYLDPGNNSQINLIWSDIEGGWAGTGNFDSTPNFRDTVEFRLQEPSRCIDAGTSDNTPDHDFEGDARNDHWQSPNRGGGQFPYYDVGWDEYVTLGTPELRIAEASGRPRPATVIRASSLPRGAVLYDITGKRVGRAPAPGVCFVRADSRGPSAAGCHKVVIPR
jgi:parallel beta-helix repeat protein